MGVLCAFGTYHAAAFLRRYRSAQKRNLMYQAREAPTLGLCMTLAESDPWQGQLWHEIEHR